MSILIYATADDLTPAWVATAPANAATLLRQASSLVRHATRLDHYATDPATRLPVEPRVIEAFRDATCQQVATWAAAGIDPDAGATGQEAAVQSQSVPGGSVTYAARPTAEAIAHAATELGRAAVVILRNEGLASRSAGLA